MTDLNWDDYVKGEGPVKYVVADKGPLKVFLSKEYNYQFNRETGLHMRWGKTKDDDPEWSPFGPEILDLEATTSCKGNCSFCYKANTPNGKNMSLDTFCRVLDKMPPTLTQVAFGADYDLSSNQEVWAMMKYARSKGIIPNITVASADDKTADLLAQHCGAVAVSRYGDKDACYDTVKRLTDRGLKQTNIHCMVSVETYIRCLKTTGDVLRDPRLAELNALVFLSLKRKGRGTKFTPLETDCFGHLVKSCLDSRINFGMDSCSAQKFLKSTEGHPQQPSFKQWVEPCEASLFSAYIDVDGRYSPCSFAPGAQSISIDVLAAKDFVKDVWMAPETRAFRAKLLAGNRSCPMYEV